MIDDVAAAAKAAVRRMSLTVPGLDLYRQQDVETDFGPAKEGQAVYRGIPVRAKQMRADEVPDGLVGLANVQYYRATVAEGIDVRPGDWFQNRTGTARYDVVGITADLDGRVRYVILAKVK